MLEELEDILPGFGSLSAHVWCFTHTINLTAKGILHPFEPKKATGEEAESDDGRGDELEAAVRDLEENGERGEDDEEGFQAVVDRMSVAERQNWLEEVEPVRKALFKVCFIYPSAQTSCVMVHALFLPVKRHAKSRSKLSTRLPTFYPSGALKSPTLSSRTEHFRRTWRPDGTPRLTCFPPFWK